MSIHCPFCGNKSIRKKIISIHSSINVCSKCFLGFSFNDISINYKDDTVLEINEKEIELYKKLARPVVDILYDFFDGLNLSGNHRLNVLEVGSGYGLLEDFLCEKYSLAYDNNELNEKLSQRLSGEGKSLVKIESGKKYDIIILSHVLEHIEDAEAFLDFLINNKLSENGYVILVQTDFRGFVPSFLPFFWYAWQTQQHYYHFNIEVFKQFVQKRGLELSFYRKYLLPQKLSWSLKGLVKLVVNMINLTLPLSKYDAFVCVLKKKTWKS